MIHAGDRHCHRACPDSSSDGDSYFHFALRSNAAWAAYKKHQDPMYFDRLAEGQAPKILWIGCSDSRCPETTILGLDPGVVFTHRNIANRVSATDLSLSSVLEYAVRAMAVSHIIVAGHTNCGGVLAALAPDDAPPLGGVLDSWIAPLRALRAENACEIEALEGEKAQATRLAEMNVAEGVRTLLGNRVVRDAIKERGLEVHGCLFGLETGRLRDLGLDTKATGKDGGKAGGRQEVLGRGEVVRGRYAQLVFREEEEGQSEEGFYDEEFGVGGDEDSGGGGSVSRGVAYMMVQ